MPRVKLEYSCKRHPKVVLATVEKTSEDDMMSGAAHPPGVIPEETMYCPKCDRHYYGWECREREVEE